MRSWDYVKALFWFNLQDTSPSIGERIDNYGLLNIDGTPKPAFAAFRAAASQMGAPGTDASSSSTAARTGSGSGTGSGVGRDATAATKPPAGGRVTLRVLRAAKRLLVSGKGPRGQAVRIDAYRYVPAKHAFAARAAHSVQLVIDASGRYSRALKKAGLRHGRWRVTATLVGSDARLARVDFGKRR
jgi:hypothetical protein